MIEKFMKIFRKESEESKIRLKRNMTANDFINVRDIKDDIVYTKDNNVFVYLKIQPISRELLSPREGRLLGKQFSSELSAVKCFYKFLSVSRPVDVAFMLDNFQNMKQSATERKRKEILSQRIKELNQFAMSGEVLEHQFYLILWQENKKNTEREILKQANEIISRFKTCGANVSICKESDIVKLFNLFANPNYAHLENAEYLDYVPFVN